MTVFRKIALAGILMTVVGSGAAIAEGYSTVDLGLVRSKSACMARAERVMHRYEDTLGAHSVSTGSWTTFGWDFEPGDQDVVILCVAPAGSSSNERRAIMVIHGSETETERFATRDILNGYWDAD
ncbi:MAG: hypothetical protein HOI22_01610 [Tateyamaria sp.]|jgi:hypothetical protein|nr:hypothetical protein [Tateyamaria sp.]